MYKYKCLVCGSDFERKNKDRKYCSSKCVSERNKVKEVKLLKTCSTCKLKKELKLFWKRKDAVNGHHYECIECGSFRNKNRSPELKEKEKLRCRRKKRIKCGLDPDFEGRYKKKSNPEVRTLSHNGYWYIYRPGHPNAQKGLRPQRGRIFEHKYIMSEHIGRALKEDECVHHKNGVRTDNRIENLELWKIGQPAGARLEDKLKWAQELLEEYGYKVIKE
jgi:hypothetical protein